MEPTPDLAALDQRLAQAMAAHRQGDLARARLLYEQIAAASPDHVQTLGLLGTLALQQGRFEGAVDWIARAAALDPADASLPSNMGLALHQLGRLDEAVASYDRALALNPDFAEAGFNRANALRGQDRQDEAVEGYDRVIALRPDWAEAHANRSNVLHEQGRLGEALAGVERAIALQPAIARLHVNRANILQDLSRLDEALDAYGRALKLDPSDAGARWNQALALLLAGDFKAGWPAHEARWRVPSLARALRRFAQPLWLGETPLEGRTILLHAEQGLGDTLQFCRYAPVVAERGARVVLTAPRSLAGLFKSLAGVDILVTDGDPLPAFDLHCPLMSLPLALGTTIETIPSPEGYLKADPALVERWAQRLGSRTRPRVGLVWSGNPGQGNDRNRSIPLERFAAALPDGFDYICLQKDIRADDRPTLAADGRIAEFSAEIGDFSDTAALATLADVVVAVDTSVAHLAAALGRPTWVALSSPPDWRYLTGRDDSPWYAAMQLFRQDGPRDWTTVLQRMGEALAALQ